MGGLVQAAHEGKSPPAVAGHSPQGSVQQPCTAGRRERLGPECQLILDTTLSPVPGPHSPPPQPKRQVPSLHCSQPSKQGQKIKQKSPAQGPVAVGIVGLGDWSHQTLSRHQMSRFAGAAVLAPWQKSPRREPEERTTVAACSGRGSRGREDVRGCRPAPGSKT